MFSHCPTQTQLPFPSLLTGANTEHFSPLSVKIPELVPELLESGPTLSPQATRAISIFKRRWKHKEGMGPPGFAQGVLSGVCHSPSTLCLMAGGRNQDNSFRFSFMGSPSGKAGMGETSSTRAALSPQQQSSNFSFFQTFLSAQCTQICSPSPLILKFPTTPDLHPALL